MRRRALLAASTGGGGTGGGGADYTPIDFVTFDGSTIFDTSMFGNNTLTIEVKFRRTDTASNVYLYGVSVSPRLSAYLGQSGYWRYGESVYPTFNTNNTTLTKATVTPGYIMVGSSYKGHTSSTFTTKSTIPLGGHISSSGVLTPQFIGEVYYFKISKPGTTLLDWTPAKNADGVEGFWDSVTNTFIAPL